MPRSAFIVRDAESQHRTVIADRDIGLLWGPFFVEGSIFSWNFGFYENFSIAGGIPKGAGMSRDAGLICSVRLLHFTMPSSETSICCSSTTCSALATRFRRKARRLSRSEGERE